MKLKMIILTFEKPCFEHDEYINIGKCTDDLQETINDASDENSGTSFAFEADFEVAVV